MILGIANVDASEPGESFQTTENRSGGVAESVFIAGLFVLAASELAEIAALLDENPVEWQLAMGEGSFELDDVSLSEVRAQRIEDYFDIFSANALDEDLVQRRLHPLEAPDALAGERILDAHAAIGPSREDERRQ